MQRPLWVSQRRHPAAPVQNMALVTRFGVGVDAPALAEAFVRVVDESDVLRTRIVDERGTPVVHLLRDAAPPEVIDLAEHELDRWCHVRAAQPIDVSIRCYDSVVLRHETGAVSWYLALHHTVTDATSSALVLEATAQSYVTGEAPAIPSYYDWATAVTTGGVRLERANAAWRERRRANGVGRLYERVRTPGPGAQRVDLSLPADLRALAEHRLATDYAMVSADLGWTALLVSLAAVFLHRVARVDEFSIGLPVHNRTDATSRSMIGPVMETYPIDVSIDRDDTFRTLHRRVSRTIMTTLRYTAPGAAPAGDFEAIVNVIPRAEMDRFGELPVTTTWLPTGAIDASSLFRLSMTAYGDGAGEFVLDLNECAASPAHQARAAAHVRSLLSAMLTDPDAGVASTALCTDEELEVLREWETVSPLAGETVDVVTRLRDAMQTSSSVVLEDGDLRWVGAELWDRIERVASGLAAQGVGPGTRVAIELPRSADVVIAIVATLVAGGSYVPIDPAQPLARRRRLVERAGCHLTVSSLPPPGEEGGAPGFEPVVAAPDDEAYLLFTSGSTGEPKGVPITRSGLAGYLRFAEETYRTDGPPVAPLFSAITFDLTVTSLFLPLIAGGRLVVIREDGVPALAEIARRPELTWCKATPSHLDLLERLLPDDHGLSVVVVGGEAFPASLARRLADRLPGGELYNEYGPTEAVVGCMIHRADERELLERPDVAIGRPAPGVTLRIVDDGLQRVPIGVAGELLIAHDGLTTGYLGGDDSAFVTLDGRRFYRSGDLVRMLDDTTCVYLGLIDEQVKVGGIRLEPTEVEAALESHPSISRAAVRLWSPQLVPAERHCIRCGLAANVPGVRYDDAGVCDTCRLYERIAPVGASWFRAPDDLLAIRDAARARRTGPYDCVALLSGGKDSTYALYRLVQFGFEPYVLTLDNGFLSPQAKENIRRTVADLGVVHEFATPEAMNAIFADSLERYSNVCNGCFKTIYTVATNKAVELGAPLVVTGLSRGQLFETRLAPQQFQLDRFDPDAIDRAVLEARKVYHRADDAVSRLLDTSVFSTDEVFEQVQFVNFYRYVEVEPAEMLSFLDGQAPWVRPSDTSRSKNCRINDAGIHTHLVEQGFHNYAIPDAWDVRLGHKVREAAIDALDDRLDLIEVGEMLEAVGYRPAPRQVLTAWFELADGHDEPSPAELRAFLGGHLPTHAIPAAFVRVDHISVTSNGKLDTRSLPAPRRAHRSSPALYVSPVSPLESTVVEVWEQVLRLEPIGVDDDFFNIGGDSFAAIEMVVVLGERIGRTIREEMAFLHATPRSLAAAIAAGGAEERPGGANPPAATVDWIDPPPLTVGERSILFEQQLRPDSLRYNVGHVFHVDGPVEAEPFAAAVRQVVGRHLSLSWTYDATRRRLTPDEAVEVTTGSLCRDEEVAGVVNSFHRRPFDLAGGPLLRVLLQPVSDRTVVLFSIHHVTGDAESFLQLWDQIDDVLCGRDLQPLATDSVVYVEWLEAGLRASDRDHWLPTPTEEPPAALAILPPPQPGLDGFLRITARFGPDALKVGAGASAFSVALAALAATLRRSSDGDAIEVGVVTSNRVHPAAEALTGYSLNTVPVRLPTPLDATLRQLTGAASSEVAAMLAHRAYPLAQIIADRRAAGLRPPRLDVMLAFHELRPGRLGTRRVEHEVLFNGEAVADATFFVELHDDRVDLAVEHRGTTMTAFDAERLLLEFESTIATVIDAPATTVATVPVVGAGSRLHGGPPVGGVTVLDDIERHLAEQGDRPAVSCGDQTITWSELDRRSRAVVAELRSRGVQPGERVVVSLPRSVELVVAVVGVMRAGAAYVPIDPTYPDERVRLIAASSGATIGIVDDPARGLTPISVVPAELAPDADGRPVKASATSNAYVIFTSGSTGRPRGVAVDHGRLAASNGARRSVYDRHPGTYLLMSSCSFDSSVAGLFWTLTSGGEVLLPTDAEAHDPDAVLRLLERADHTLMVPTLYEALLERGSTRERWPSVVVVAGEACPARLVRRHHEVRPDSALYNEYGPTEATVWCSVHRCRPGDDPVPIGLPIPGAWLDVVDPTGHSVPRGVVGELIVGGAGVVEGYDGLPEETARRFERDADGTPVFHTGDRVVVRDDTVHFLGRVDHQLNLGGVRAEPEEIERIVAGVPGVGAVLVVAADPRSLDDLLRVASPDAVRVAMADAAAAADPGSALLDALRLQVPGTARLVAHLERADADEVDLATVRTRVTALLPPLLRPTSFVVHDALPRTANGKLDRDAAQRLPIVAADGMRPSGAPGASAGSTAGRLVEVVRNEMSLVLGRPLDADESFFDAGGHSLLALELVARLEERLGAAVTVATLYDTDTATRLGTRIAEWGGASDQFRFLVPIRSTGSKPPIYGVHVLGGNASFFRPLAAELGDDQPMFGLGLIDEASSARAPTDVAEACRLYADELQRNTPTGPVVLAAVSIGAVAAIELARLLTEQGREVNALVLFDAVGPAAERYAPQGTERLRMHARLMASDPGGYAAARLTSQWAVVKWRAEQAELAARLRLGIDVPERLRQRRFVEQNIASARSIELWPFPGRVIVIRAGDELFTEPVAAHGMGWLDVFPQVEVVTSPGGHLTMLQPPHVTHLAPHLRF